MSDFGQQRFDGYHPAGHRIHARAQKSAATACHFTKPGVACKPLGNLLRQIGIGTRKDNGRFSYHASILVNSVARDNDICPTNRLDKGKALFQGEMPEEMGNRRVSEGFTLPLAHAFWRCAFLVNRSVSFGVALFG